jgi:hypothetical protein
MKRTTEALAPVVLFVRHPLGAGCKGMRDLAASIFGVHIAVHPKSGVLAG